MLCLFMMPVIVFASSEADTMPITVALGMEAFVSVHMSIFVLRPLSVIFSPQNSWKTFWELFILRVVILLIFDFLLIYFILDLFKI